MNADSGAVNKKIEELGIQLQKPVKPVANYVTTVQTGNLVFTSGHGPIGDDGQLILGQLGTDMDIEGGYQAARAVGIGLLSTLKATLGNLDRIKKIVKLVGFVNSSADFTFMSLPALSSQHRETIHTSYTYRTYSIISTYGVQYWMQLKPTS